VGAADLFGVVDSIAKAMGQADVVGGEMAAVRLEMGKWSAVGIQSVSGVPRGSKWQAPPSSSGQ
jgi:hypothetical protein